MDNKENICESVFMYQETSKQNILDFKKTFKYKAGFDWIILLAIVIICVGIAIIFYTTLGVILEIVGIILIGYRLSKRNSKKDVAFLDAYEKYLKAQEKKYQANSNSAIYETYYSYDNKTKRFAFWYQDKKYIDISYDDIISYDILNDKVISSFKRLPDRPNPTVKSYILRLNLKNGRVVEIGYSNTNKYIKIRNSIVYQQFANTMSVNKLCNVFDRIITKNRV